MYEQNNYQMYPNYNYPVKKKKKTWLIVLIISIVVVLITTIGITAYFMLSKNELVGTWYCSDGYDEVTLKFKKNGDLEMSVLESYGIDFGMTSKYKINKELNTIDITTSYYGFSDTETMSYYRNGNQLVLDNELVCSKK